MATIEGLTTEELAEAAREGRPVLDIVFTSLPDSSDERGMSFSLHGSVLEGMAAVRDVHIASLRPGGIRGNHFHAVKNEVITVAYADKWSFYWDTGEGTQVRRRQFAETGAVAVNVPPGWSHAVRNEGASDLWLFNASDATYLGETGTVADSHRRVVVR